MRLTLALGCSFAAVVTVFACSSDDGGGSSGTLFVPEGGMILEDGAVVGPDGELVEQPDATPPKPSKVNLTDEQVDVGGKNRPYVLSVPKTYDASRKYPLVVAMHGDGDTGLGFSVGARLDEVAGGDAVIAYPTGANDLFTPFDQNDDQRMIEAIISAVKAKRSINEGKVWAFGYSKGGYMAAELACHKPGLFTAMAIHAGGAPARPAGAPFPDCPGAAGIPTIVTHGSQDDPGGGEYGAAVWARIAACATARAATTPPPCERYDNCPGGKAVVYCQVAGLTHFPMWDQAAAVSWGFFSSL